MELARALLHAASLLEETTDRFSTLPALRVALAPLLPVTYLEVVYRDGRAGCFERASVWAGRAEVTRSPVPTAWALAFAIESGNAGAGTLASFDLLQAPGLADAELRRLARAPLRRGDASRGWIACAGPDDEAYDAAQLELLGDLGLLIGAALATDRQTATLATQSRIAELLASGGEVTRSFGELAEHLRNVLHFEHAALVGPAGPDGSQEVLATAGSAMAAMTCGVRIDGEEFPGARPRRMTYEPLWNAHESLRKVAAAGVRSLLHLPLVFKGERQGCLCLTSSLENAYLDEDAERAEGIATLCAAHLALQQSVRRLESSEAEYRGLYHQIAATHTQLVQAEKLASVGQLAAGVAHEINNPAAVVMSNLSHLSATLPDTRRLLARYRTALRAADPAAALRLASDELAVDLPTVEAELDEAVGESLHAMRRIRDIVRSLMRFARGPSAQPEMVNLRDLAERAVSVAQNELRHRARLVRDYRVVPNILADPGSLEQVLVNLLLNAAQSIPEGDAESHEIRVRVAEESGFVVVEIRDDGVGIPAEVLPRVFDPFFTTKPVGQGTGLGLSIAHDVVSKHGGEIQLESEPKRGTCVRVRLPLPGPSGAVATTGSPETAAAPPQPARPVVMIVDDEPGVLRAAERLLRGDFATVCVASGDAALRSLASNVVPDLIICDLMMPAMTGADLYEHIAERYPHLEPRVMFMTGGAFTPRARAFAERMEARLVEKPLDGKELREVVQRNLSNRR